VVSYEPHNFDKGKVNVMTDELNTPDFTINSSTKIYAEVPGGLRILGTLADVLQKYGDQVDRFIVNCPDCGIKVHLSPANNTIPSHKILFNSHPNKNPWCIVGELNIDEAKRWILDAQQRIKEGQPMPGIKRGCPGCAERVLVLEDDIIPPHEAAPESLEWLAYSNDPGMHKVECAASRKNYHGQYERFNSTRVSQ
jgi:endogenous inhibitor of DNA gyrase (YacG/DUF329 family)